jgi:hypothetical protein
VTDDRQPAPAAVRLGGLAVTVGLVAAVAWRAYQPLVNYDTYFHLRIGHELLGDWSLRSPGSLSSTGTADWVPTQWASEIAMAGMEDAFGLAGVAWLAGATYLAYAAALVVACRLQAPLLAAAPVAAAALAASSDGLTARPQVLSYLLTVVTVAAWLATWRDGRVRWWLVAVGWVWANVHGMWPLGVVLSGVAAVGVTLDRRTSPRALLVPVLAAAAAVLTPVGPRLYPAVVTVASRASSVTEWAPPDFTDPLPMLLGALLGAALLLRLRGTPEDRAWTHDLLLLLACAFAVYSTRTVPIAAALAAPLLARLLAEHLPPPTSGARREAAAVVGIAAAALVVLAVALPTTDPEIEEPAVVAARLGALPAGTTVLTDPPLGSYVAWRFPDLDLVNQGYFDMYTDEQFDDLTGLSGLRPGWEDTLARTGATIAVLDEDDALAGALPTVGWHRTQSEDGLVVLERTPDAA